MPEAKKIIMSGTGLTKIFGFGRQKTLAVDHVNIDLNAGEVVSIVGESGSGKTTLAKLLLGLIGLTEGRFTSRGKSVISVRVRRNGNTGKIFRRSFRIRSLHTICSRRLMQCYWIVFACVAVESFHIRKKLR